MAITSFVGSGADALTGERIFPGESVLDTGLPHVSNPYMFDTITCFLKEATLVWLAEQAGYSLVKRDEGDSGDAESVDGEDVGVRGGETPTGKDKARGKSAAKRRSNGPVEGE
jgi:hypothetical protein